MHQSNIEHVTWKGIIPFPISTWMWGIDGIGGLLPYFKPKNVYIILYFYIIYPPYLLLMYQVQQIFQLLNATKHLCLERDVQRLKCQHPQWSEIDVFKNIMKFKLPPCIPLTPQWHHTQFKKLLVLMKNFRMPHFFLTLIYDETSNFRWKEIEDIFLEGLPSWMYGIIFHRVASLHVNLCSWWWKHFWHCQTSCNMIRIVTSRWVKA